MSKIIKLKLEETYEIPDTWELLENDEGITKIKVREGEYYDFGSIPFKSSSLVEDDDTMLSFEETDELINRGLTITSVNSDITELNNECEEKILTENRNYKVEIYLKNGSLLCTPFNAQYNHNFGTLIGKFEKYIETKKQNKYTFRLIPLDSKEVLYLTIDFEEVAMIKGIEV